MTFDDSSNIFVFTIAPKIQYLYPGSRDNFRRCLCHGDYMFQRFPTAIIQIHGCNIMV